MSSTIVRNKGRGVRDIALVRAQFRNPYCVGSDSLVLILLEQLLLNFGGSPKTFGSGRADQHQHPNLAGVLVEHTP
jgi:hypothetical protein